MTKKLLLADDSVTIQRVIELTFADEDIQVIAVGDGKQAISRIEAEKPDVVLADVGMPERDGYEVAAHVKGSPELAHIPVLLLTGAFEPIDEARARAVGCDGVLVKPFEPQMVINRVKDLLAGRRPSNLWTSPPGPSGAAVPAVRPVASAQQVPSAATPEPRAATEEKRLESLDDYFDRLDEAFSNETPAQAGAAAAPPPPSSTPALPAPMPPSHDTTVDFGGWDIPVETKATRQPAAPPPMSVAPPPLHPVPAPEPVSLSATVPTLPAEPVSASAPTLSPVPAAPALADAFAALLAAEQQMGTALGAPAQPAASAAPAMSEDEIEQIVRRVLARMTEDTVRTTVLDVAERLVREEIERIKKQ